MRLLIELPTVPILESSGLATDLPTELPNLSVYGSLICMAKEQFG